MPPITTSGSIAGDMDVEAVCDGGAEGAATSGWGEEPARAASLISDLL